MRLLIAAIAIAVSATPAAARDWYRAETNNFIIISEDDEEDVRHFAAELERYDMALRTLQNLPIGEEQPSEATKLTVYRFGEPRDIGRLVNARSVLGFYIPYAGDNVAFAPARQPRRRSMTVVNVDRSRNRQAETDINTVLNHEYVHYFMLQRFAATYPRWYVEGYAELMSTLRYNEDNSFHVGDPPQDRAYQIFQMSAFDLEEMLDENYTLRGMDVLQHYATGWLFNHYMFFDPQRYAQLNEYLIALGQGEDSLTAARRIFGDLDRMNRELFAYKDGGEGFPGIDVTIPNYVDPQVEIRELTDSEESLIRQEMELRMKFLDNDDAAGVARDIIARSGGQMPSDPHALELLIRAYTQAEDWQRVLEASDRLTEIDPEAIIAPISASYAAAELSRNDATWHDRAVQYAADALFIDEYDPRSRIAYFYTFLAADMEVPENAIIALEQAFDAAGSDPSYRILLARQLIFEDRLNDARTVLQPIAFQGHNQRPQNDEERDPSERPPSLDEIMDEIEAGNRDAALAMIDEAIEWEPEDA